MKSYVIPCASPFRDAILALAERRACTVSDLASSTLLLLKSEQFQEIDDPGDAPPGDREAVELRSGPRAGTILRRKPRLQLRLAKGLDAPTIRRALATALALDTGDWRIALHPKDVRLVNQSDAVDATEIARHREAARRWQQQAEELRAIIGLLAFETGGGAIHTVAEARYVLGFPPSASLSRETVKARFRLLSQIFHPDKPTGDNHRMGQLIEASRLLERRLAEGRA